MGVEQKAESQHIGMGWKRLILFSAGPGTSRTDIRRARLRSLARRTAIGSLVTMGATVANFTVVMVRNGVAAWLCMILCKVDGESLPSPPQNTEACLRWGNAIYTYPYPV